MNFLIYTDELKLSEPVRLRVSAGSVYLADGDRQLGRKEYRRLSPTRLVEMEEQGLRRPGYVDFLHDRGTYHGGYIYVHVSHAIEAGKYWLPKNYTIGPGLVPFVTGKPLTKETLEWAAPRVYASLRGDFSNGILLRFLGQSRSVIYEQYFGPEYTQLFLPDLSGVIEINSYRFEQITGTAATKSSIKKYKVLLQEHLKDAGDYRVCIRTTDKAKHWFNTKMEPAPRVRRVYPSLFARAKNLMSTVLGAIYHSFSPEDGKPRVFAPKQEVQRRLDICRACPKFDPQREKCTLCGCKMPYKVELQSAHCPHPDGDKWRQDE